MEKALSQKDFESYLENSNKILRDFNIKLQINDTYRKKS